MCMFHLKKRKLRGNEVFRYVRKIIQKRELAVYVAPQAELKLIDQLSEVRFGEM